VSRRTGDKATRVISPGNDELQAIPDEQVEFLSDSPLFLHCYHCLDILKPLMSMLVIFAYYRGGFEPIEREKEKGKGKRRGKGRNWKNQAFIEDDSGHLNR
jgi:hypothetical protein